MTPASYLGRLTGYPTDVVRSLAISADAQWLALGMVDGCCQLWDLPQEQWVATLYHERHMCHVDAVAFHPTRSLLATAAHAMIMLWDVTTKRPAGPIPYPPDPADQARPTDWWMAPLHSPAHSRLRDDNQRGLGIWAFPHGNTLSFSPDGHRLACGAAFTGHIGVWDLTTGRIVRVLAGHTGHVYATCFSSDGHWFASVGNDATVQLWDRHTGHCRWIGSRHTNAVTSVAFSPDSTTVISADTDGWIYGWECATGAHRFTLKTPSGSSSSSLHPHGHVLAVGHWDGMLRLWDLRHRRLLQEVPSPIPFLQRVAFDPTGQRLVTGGYTLIEVMDERIGPITDAVGQMDVWRVEAEQRS